MEPYLDTTHWGLRPILFHLGRMAVPSYSVFMLLALAVGAACYMRASRALGVNRIYLFTAAMVGGTLGAKLPEWLLHSHELLAPTATITQWLSGRTVAGGLIGGALAVILTRRALGLALPSGNLFAPGLALAMAVGRVGCLLRGCCAGIPTTLPWGVDFGDGVRRHPTQAYEMLFDLLLFAVLLLAARRGAPPGRLFALLMLGYFTMRFFVEFLRLNPPVCAGLTLAQLASLGVVAYYGYSLWQHRRGTVE